MRIVVSLSFSFLRSHIEPAGELWTGIYISLYVRLSAVPLSVALGQAGMVKVEASSLPAAKKHEEKKHSLTPAHLLSDRPCAQIVLFD